MQNKVELLEGDIIYVEKIGSQTADSLRRLMAKISKLAATLRAQNKPVLILSNAEREGIMSPEAIKAAAKVGKDLDFDKSATYGSAPFLHALREHMVNEAQLNDKVANFATREEALKWLLR